MSNNKQNPNSSPEQYQQGMTLIEVTIAVLILTIALLAVQTTVTFALQNNLNSRNLTQSKMLMTAMHEQIETLRNTEQLTFGQIANINQVDNPDTGIQFAGFPNDFRQISTDAGVDGIFGTTDDVANSLDANSIGYRRKVVITNINNTLKQIDVTVTYPGFRGTLQEVKLSSYLNNNALTNQQ